MTVDICYTQVVRRHLTSHMAHLQAVFAMRNICAGKPKLTPVEEQNAEIVERKVSGVREVYVWMLSKIGRSIDQPAIASVQIISVPKINDGRMKKEAERTVDYQLETVGDSFTDLTDGEIPVC